MTSLQLVQQLRVLQRHTAWSADGVSSTDIVQRRNEPPIHMMFTRAQGSNKLSKKLGCSEESRGAQKGQKCPGSTIDQWCVSKVSFELKALPLPISTQSVSSLASSPASSTDVASYMLHFTLTS